MCIVYVPNHIEMYRFCLAASVEKCGNALITFVKNEGYHLKKAYVLSNAREITTNCEITYILIYDVMLLRVRVVK